MNKISLLSISLLIFICSCTKSEYDQLIKTEMAKEMVKDSLFLGMNLGQTKKEFFDKCWKLNNEGKIFQGSSNKFVEYLLPEKEGTPVEESMTMLFYGIFNKEKIMTGMDMKLYYSAWSLWNKALQSDKLRPVVQDSLMSWFPGNDFILVPAKKTKGEIYVKVDGYRRIIIEPISDDREIDVRIDDLRFKED